MYKVTTKSEWFLCPVGRPLKNNTTYIATERSYDGALRASQGKGHSYKINNTWYDESCFKEIVNMEELVGRKFRVSNIGNLKDIIYNISAKDSKGYMISWISPNGGGYHSLCYTHDRVHQYIINKDWILIEPEFKLPEKWCIQVTPENAKVIYNWLDKNNQTEMRYSNLFKTDITCMVHYPAINNSPRWIHHQEPQGIINIGYTEITFEQFKKYVLKEDVNTSQTSNEGKSYTYEEIEKALRKDFGKEDSEEILETIKKIK